MTFMTLKVVNAVDGAETDAIVKAIKHLNERFGGRRIEVIVDGVVIFVGTIEHVESAVRNYGADYEVRAKASP